MDYQNILTEKRRAGNLRALRNTDNVRTAIEATGREFVNLSSNDYLGLAGDRRLRKEFLESTDLMELSFSSSSSRLLTGTCSQYEMFEKELAAAYGSEAALVLGSGYHANEGILPAVSDDSTLILADKLVHASLIDGIQLSRGKCIRYRHNDYDQLERLVEANHDNYETIIVVTESIFSMDGDEADLPRLVDLKRRHLKVKLYIDEAHSVGLRGEKGLGCCEQHGCINDIDFLVCTLGKALASNGAFLICSADMKEFLVNTMRPFIFSTALPPVNLAWSRFIFSRLASFSERRGMLEVTSKRIREYAKSLNSNNLSISHIIPVVIGDSNKTMELAEKLQREGYYIMPVRPPSVPAGTARLRISMHSGLNEMHVERLIGLLRSCLNG